MLKWGTEITRLSLAISFLTLTSLVLRAVPPLLTQPLETSSKGFCKATPPSVPESLQRTIESLNLGTQWLGLESRITA